MPPRVADRFAAVLDTVRTEYQRDHADPWIVAYSGGKDSTLLLHLVWEALAAMPEGHRRRNIHVVSNDTLVESPLVISHLRSSLERIGKAAQDAGLPVYTHITTPYIDQTFWVNVIGKGYIPPTRNFRWCTDRMKIEPTNRLLENLVAEHGRAILLIGTRKAESSNRRRTMERHGTDATTMTPHGTIQDCRMFAPLADLDDNDVWQILIQRKPPWGGTHRNLITLYRNAGGGECPLVLTKEDAPSCGTTSPRFGCWTCTVVKKDRSMRGTIDAGHKDSVKLEDLADFRDWLMELREDSTNRMPVRRDSRSKEREDGSRISGPFTMEVRKRILARLQQMEKELGEQLISELELEFIEDIWRRDQIQEDARQDLIRGVGAAA